MIRAVVIGQSHSAAISQALASDNQRAKEISVYRLADSKRPFEQDTISLNTAARIVEDLPAGMPVFLSVLGTYHNILGLLRSGPDFDFLLDPDEHPASDSNVRVPHRALASAFEGVFEEAKPIRTISAAAKSTVYLISAPPPKRSNDFILEHLLRQKKQSYRGTTIVDVGVERPVSRLKLWQLEARLMKSWAENQGMSFIPAPPPACDCDGFLRPEFYHADATHANDRYGTLVIQQIRDILGKNPLEAVHA